MENRLVSVIVVCFNEYARIGGTLDSVLTQDYEKIECIVVDGGSTDGSLDIIKKYEEKFAAVNRKIVVSSEPDKGIYDAMNKGRSRASGEWIQFLNAGDYFHGSSAVRNILQGVDDEDEIVIGKVIFFDGYLGKEVEHSPIEELKKDMIFCHQAIFAKKELLQNHPFDISYRYCADYEWLLAMYLEGEKIRCIDSIVADYDGNGVSSKQADGSKKEMAQIQKQKSICNDMDSGMDVNWKYRIYKYIGKYRFSAWLFAYTVGKKKQYYLKRKGL